MSLIRDFKLEQKTSRKNGPSTSDPQAVSQDGKNGLSASSKKKQMAGSDAFRVSVTVPDNVGSACIIVFA